MTTDELQGQGGGILCRRWLRRGLMPLVVLLGALGCGNAQSGELEARLKNMVAGDGDRQDVQYVLELLRDTQPLFLRWRNRLALGSSGAP